MAIEFNCHVCGKLLRTADKKAGKVAKCPGCGESLSVPAAEEGADDFESDEAGLDEYGDESSRSAQSGATKACPMCGEQIQRAARRCRFCGEDVDDRYSSRSTSYTQPHRGAMILTFSILSWFLCFIFGIVAWVMASGDLKEIKAGRMDPSGEGITRAGQIVAMVQLGFMACVLLMYCAIFIFAAAAGGM